MTSRRAFVTSLAGSALLASLDPLQAFAKLSEPSGFFSKGSLDLAQIDRAGFEPLVKEVFVLETLEGDSVGLTLEKVTDDWVQPYDPKVKIEQLSLIFRGPADAPQPQGLYPLENKQTGSFDLMLVPIALDNTGCIYQAVFSRIL